MISVKVTERINVFLEKARAGQEGKAHYFDHYAAVKRIHRHIITLATAAGLRVEDGGYGRVMVEKLEITIGPSPNAKHRVRAEAEPEWREDARHKKRACPKCGTRIDDRQQDPGGVCWWCQGKVPVPWRASGQDTPLPERMRHVQIAPFDIHCKVDRCARELQLFLRSQNRGRLADPEVRKWLERELLGTQLCGLIPSILERGRELGVLVRQGKHAPYSWGTFWAAGQVTIDMGTSVLGKPM